MATGSAGVNKNLSDWADRQRGAVIMLAKVWVGKLEGRAKSNAKWTDRTSNARNGLFGTTEIAGNEVKIYLGHSIDYGVFLELANEGKYAILKPTIDAAIPEIHRDYKKLWE